MKIIRLFIIAAVALNSFAVKAQDTLLMKSGQEIASQIMEITPALVRYKKADNPEGPVYVVNIVDINFIKYRNGTIDTIKSMPVAPPVVKKTEPAGDMSGTWSANPPPVVPRPIDPNPPVTQAGPFYRYDNRRIGKREMYEVLENMNDPEINFHVKKARTAKGIEYVGFVAIPAVAFGAVYTLVAQISNSSGGNGLSYAPGAIGFGIGAATLATSITFKIIGRNHREAAIKLYNEKY